MDNVTKADFLWLAMKVAHLEARGRIERALVGGQKMEPADIEKHSVAMVPNVWKEWCAEEGVPAVIFNHG